MIRNRSCSGTVLTKCQLMPGTTKTRSTRTSRSWRRPPRGRDRKEQEERRRLVRACRRVIPVRYPWSVPSGCSPRELLFDHSHAGQAGDVGGEGKVEGKRGQQQINRGPINTAQTGQDRKDEQQRLPMTKVGRLTDKSDSQRNRSKVEFGRTAPMTPASTLTQDEPR